ncbi:hypothetical protein [Pseudomonas sp. Marseille-Q5115]|uniref:hypothetical protein n=1 Tax=Pseudomonas sp. Marseille-Q5115 TaxID=2866593 RepID=UPI001CE3C047|nr:hypothetical protein [Pseudomonas sp. Marseille-Q5115]
MRVSEPPSGAKSKRIFLSADPSSPEGPTVHLLPRGSFIVVCPVAGNALENAPSSKKSVGFVSAAVVLVMPEPFVLLLWVKLGFLVVLVPIQIAGGVPTIKIAF